MYISARIVYIVCVWIIAISLLFVMNTIPFFTMDGPIIAGSLTVWECAGYLLMGMTMAFWYWLVTTKAGLKLLID